MKEGLGKIICKTYGVRNSRRQKDAFLSWAREVLEKEGIPAKISVDPCLARNRNLLIGDFNSAEVVVTAHYDTPKMMLLPICMYLDSFWLSLLSQVWGIALILLAVQLLLSFLGQPFWVRYWAFFLSLALFFFTVNNRNNHNDNSSGVIGVLECARRCREEKIPGAAFVLFDNEEWGLLGSAGFAKAHRDQMKGKLVINLDCIGAGDEIVLVTKQEALNDARNLAASLNGYEGKKRISAQTSKNILVMSDHASFARSIMVSAFRRDRMGRKLTRIHRWTDTVLDEENVDLVCDFITEYLRKKSVE